MIATVRDEERHLEAAVRSVLENGYEPGVEVALAVGPSRDGTLTIARELAADPRVTVVDNPSGLTPQGLNLAIAATGREVIVRIDGHTVLPLGYIARAIDVLNQTGAANVGGQMVPVGDAPTERAVAWAMSSRWGIGAARFHVGGEAGEAETVFLGVFRREALDAVGAFDERFSRAQDWELNYRLRAAGYIVWFDPKLRVEYRPRSRFGSLARQFHGSGRWRREVVRTHRGTASARYLAPPALVASLLAACVAGATGLAIGMPWLAALGFSVPMVYGAAVVVVAASAIPSVGWRTALRIPLVLGTMHLSWGLGFWRGMP